MTLADVSTLVSWPSNVFSEVGAATWPIATEEIATSATATTTAVNAALIFIFKPPFVGCHWSDIQEHSPTRARVIPSGKIQIIVLESPRYDDIQRKTNSSTS